MPPELRSLWRHDMLLLRDLVRGHGSELPRLGSQAEHARVVPVLFRPNHVDALELWETASQAICAELMAAWHASFFRCPPHAPRGHPAQ